jgi:hypothetical protein
MGKPVVDMRPGLEREIEREVLTATKSTKRSSNEPKTSRSIREYK